MEDQGKFLEMLQEIKEVAAASQNKLTREEIKSYLGTQELSEEKMRAVYQYLGENHIEVEGYDFTPAGKADIERPQENKEERSNPKISRGEENLKLYQQEISKFSGDLQQEEKLILSFLQGNDELKDTIIEKYLQKVVSIAKRYESRGVAEDEIIAEGNVGLMVAMKVIQENRGEYLRADGSLEQEKFFGTLEMEVVHAMQSYIDEMTESKDWENTVVAKINLLHEATKYMTEEMGRVPTIEELSEYTKISREEINHLRGLSEDTKRVAQEK